MGPLKVYSLTISEKHQSVFNLLQIILTQKVNQIFSHLRQTDNFDSVKAF